MSLPQPSLLVNLSSSIRARPVPWDSYQRAGVVTDTELKRIKAVEKASREGRVEKVEADLEGYVGLVLSSGDAETGKDGKALLERSKNRTDVVQFVLVLVGELCEDVPTFTQAILQHPNPYDNLISLLNHSDNPIPILSSSIMTTLLSSSLLDSHQPLSTKSAFPILVQYLSGLASSSESNLQDLAIQGYVTILRTSYARAKFWDMGDTILNPLVQIIETAAKGSGNRTDVGLASSASSVTAVNVGGAGLQQGGVGLQVLYHVLLVFWELSFEEVVAEELNPKYDLILPLVQILRSAIKEKILRLTLAILSNLLLKAPSTNQPALLLAKILPLLNTLKSRHFNDEDLTTDLTTCLEKLESYQMTQTTFDEYAHEVRSGHLSWTPPHRSDDFWKKNARRIMEENSGELPKCLADVLRESEDKTALAVAAHDVGILVKEVSEKRRVWDGLAVKAQVMRLMGDSDPEVRFESLKTVQEFLRYAFGG